MATKDLYIPMGSVRNAYATKFRLLYSEVQDNVTVYTIDAEASGVMGQHTELNSGAWWSRGKFPIWDTDLNSLPDIFLWNNATNIQFTLVIDSIGADVSTEDFTIYDYVWPDAHGTPTSDWLTGTELSGITEIASISGTSVTTEDNLLTNSLTLDQIKNLPSANRLSITGSSSEYAAETSMPSTLYDTSISNRSIGQYGGVGPTREFRGPYITLSVEPGNYDWVYSDSAYTVSKVDASWGNVLAATTGSTLDNIYFDVRVSYIGPYVCTQAVFSIPFSDFRGGTIKSAKLIVPVFSQYGSEIIYTNLSSNTESLVLIQEDSYTRLSTDFLSRTECAALPILAEVNCSTIGSLPIGTEDFSSTYMVLEFNSEGLDWLSSKNWTGTADFRIISSRFIDGSAPTDDNNIDSEHIKMVTPNHGADPHCPYLFIEYEESVGLGAVF